MGSVPSSLLLTSHVAPGKCDHPAGTWLGVKQVEIRPIISPSLVLRPSASKSSGDGVGLGIKYTFLEPTTVLLAQYILADKVQELVFPSKLSM